MMRFLETNLALRIASSLLMLALGAAWLMAGPVGFLVGLTLLIAALLSEWWTIARPSGVGMALFGIPYIGLTAAVLYHMRFGFWHFTLTPDESYAYGIIPLGLSVVVLTVVDVSAYIAGKLIGGPKLAPAISPGKTWAGLGGAMLGTGGLFLLMAMDEGSMSPIRMVLAGYALAIAAQLGDLFESWLKRRAGVKDSGRLIPGHGGVLDRVDGYLTAVPLLWFLMNFAL